MSHPESQFYNNAIFWVDVEKIKPNPFQPRRDFDPLALKALSDSIRQYGVLQALVVTRKEIYNEDGSMSVEYELIAGERRLRASKLAGLQQVPVLIRAKEDSDLMKLELAIIENIQREDLNAVDRAKAFNQLSKEFGFKHSQIAEKVGKSREYVSNTIRILALPEFILIGLSEGKISEGHTRPLLMLDGRPEEQDTLFKEIVFKKLNVREAEGIARKIAVEKTRKKDVIDPEIAEIEGKFTESLGTRVSIEKKEVGGKLTIDFFSNDDLRAILLLIEKNKVGTIAEIIPEDKPFQYDPDGLLSSTPATEGSEDKNEDDDELYSVRNFSI
ncbi:MAG: ParB/RepB/Spo0J family partition protein [Candidatus Paceibacterota bacterium]|jgi:ParB family chromosome partitioning protein